MSFDDNVPPEGFRQRGLLPTETRLLLIRHAESYGNARGVAAGPIGDGGLTEMGRLQALALAKRLERTKELHDATAFYTSTLPRTIETGSIVFPAINPDIAPKTDDDLVELKVGDADDMTWSEIRSSFPEVNWDDDPSLVNVPGGESLIDFYTRCEAAFYRIVERHPHELVVIVAHGGVIEQAMKVYQGLPAGYRLQPRIEHCSMTEIEFIPGRPRLFRYNDLSPIGVE